MRPPDTVFGGDFQVKQPAVTTPGTGAGSGRNKVFQGLDGRKDRRIIRRPDSLKDGLLQQGSRRTERRKGMAPRIEKVFRKGLTAGTIAV
jgi:hypothetical protein